MENNSGIKLRNFFKRWPRFYYFVGTVFGPMWFSGLSTARFLKKFPSVGTKLNLGSGPRVLSADVTNVDVFPYQGVKIVADVSNLPMPDNSVSQIICDNVIEHVKDPGQVIKEIGRVLEKGGSAYFTVPFLYPFHSSPDDFHRWTRSGFLEMLKDFEIVEVGVRAGAFSAITVYLCYLFALLFSFGNKELYWLLVNLSMFIFFPIKCLDFIFGRLPQTSNLAAEMYYVVKKK